jgi:tetratricopeptide (TPR) repeat protein
MGTTIKLWCTHTHRELRSFTGHTDRIFCAAFSPDGTTLASASGDHTLKLWDPQTGQVRRTLHGHTSRVRGVAYSSNGLTLASAGGDKTIRLWDPRTSEPLATLEGHIDEVTSVAFSPDGSTLASASWDHTIKLWDLKTHRARTTLAGHAGRIWCVAFSPDGKTLASSSGDKTIRLWDAQNGWPRVVLRNCFLTSGSVRGAPIAFSPDGMMLVSGGDARVTAGELAAQWPEAAMRDPIEMFRFGTIKIWDALAPEANTTSFHRRRAMLWRYSKQYDRALEDLNRAIELEPKSLVPHDSDDWVLWQTRALADFSLNQWEQAIEGYNQAIKLKPDEPMLYSDRAKAYLALDRYDEALADWNRYVELGNDGARALLSRAQLLLMTDRTDAYRRACAEILNRFGQLDDAGALCPAVRACTLAPKAVPDPMVLVEMAQRAASGDARGYTLHPLGMAHLRAGQVDEAVDRFQESLSITPEWERNIRFLNWLGLALAYHEMGEPEEARQWLGKAIDFMQQHHATHTPRLEGQILRREVEQLLEDPEQAEDDTESGSEE